MRTPDISSRRPARSSIADGAPVISPQLSRVMNHRASGGSYGCQREVYHPKSPKAEPTAAIFWDSDDDVEDSDYEDTSESPLKNVNRRPVFSPKAKSTDIRSSPLNPNRRALPATLESSPDLKGSTITNYSDAKTVDLAEQLKQLKMEPKTRTVSPPRESDVSEETTSASTPSTPAPVDKQRRHSVQIKIEDSPAPNLPKQAPAPQTPASTPSAIPLPSSPGSSEIGSTPSSPGSTVANLPSITPPGKRLNQAIADTRQRNEAMKALFVKAEAYSEAITWKPIHQRLDPKAQTVLDKVYNDENRFNPEECLRNEALYQARISAVINLRKKEEERVLAIIEAARAEERKKFEAEQARLAADQERFRLDQEAKQAAYRAQIERHRQEAETQRLKEEAERVAAAAKAREEQATKDEAEKKKKAESEAVAKAAQEALRKAAEEAAKMANSPGRMTAKAESENIFRVLKNLKEVRAKARAAGDWVKSTGINAIVRELRPRFGQLTGEKQQTITLRDNMKVNFRKVLAIPNQPPVNLRDFIIIPIPAEQDGQVPLGWIYVLNELAKGVVRQVAQEAGANSKTAEPIGVMLASIFGDAEFKVNGVSFIDIFLARLMKRNPILRGEVGPERSEADMERLGWERDEDGKFEDDETHINRITGLSAGWVCIAARDFRLSKNLSSPYPIYHLWNKLAQILNIPEPLITNTHYFAVKIIMERAAAKMIAVYGNQAVKLIEVACGEWAEQGVKRNMPGATGLKAWALKQKEAAAARG